MIELKISDVFSDSPSGRYRSDGENSAERLRDDILIKAYYESNEDLTFDFSDVFGLSTAFTEECFGGLVRVHNIDLYEFRKRVTLKATSSFVLRSVLKRADKFMVDAMNYKAEKMLRMD